MTKFLHYLFLVILLSCGHVKTDKNKERLDSVCDKVMHAFRGDNISEAMKLLKQNSTVSDSDIDTLEATINEQMKNLYPSYGKMLSYEFVSEHRIKNIIAKRFYLLKFEKFCLKFAFSLYNNGADWTITGFKYEEEMTELLK